jgi:4-diphosphocytidyl-2C-methyl-D-erythritol kinase
MSGSGACVFAEFADREAGRARCRLPEGIRSWVAAGLPRHPLRGLAD